MTTQAASLEVDIGTQSLSAWNRERTLIERYPVSTAANGTGQQKDSLRTPLGHHVVRARIGQGMPRNMVFRGRRPTGEIYSEALGRSEPGRDWILTRILWLSGLQIGINRLGSVDTMQRFIYIHGAPDEYRMGIPRSRGCIQMRNPDLLEIFDMTPVGTPVYIHA